MKSCRNSIHDVNVPKGFTHIQGEIMALNIKRLVWRMCFAKDSSLLGCRRYSAGGKAKKGSKGGSADAPKVIVLDKEVKAATVYGANIFKEGTDPKVLPDSNYPGWLFQLLDKPPFLSDLKRKSPETLSYEELRRFVKLDNRARIKEDNGMRGFRKQNKDF